MQNIQLSNGVAMPQIGYGLWQVKGKKDVQTGVKAALEAGYTHFDTAQIYGNEAMLGEELKKSGVKREDLFITSKLWNDNQFLQNIEPSFQETLKNLQTDYVDLFLVHFPVTQSRRMAWMGLQDIYKSGRAKAIGVSNYTIKHLEELLQWADVKPMVNQVELHVFLQQPELLTFCERHDIAVEAYSPLAHGHGLDNDVLVDIANKHGKTPAQIMIRWCIEVGTMPLPKSVTPERIQQNAEVFDFELDEDDMQLIADLNSDFRTCWDPTNVA